MLPQLKTADEIAAMSLAEIEAYRQQLDEARLAFRAHCVAVSERFRDLTNAINAAAKMGASADALRVTPGVALAKTMREQLGRTAGKGGPLLAAALEQ